MRVARLGHVTRTAGARLFSSQAVDVESPYSGAKYAHVPYLSQRDALAKVEEAAWAQKEWAKVPLADRIAVVRRFMAEFHKMEDRVAKDITGQMGKPLGQAKNEVKGLFSRINALIDQAPEALRPDIVQADGAFLRKVEREPVGTVALISPWNYPLLTTGNVLIAAVLAGNAVALKHSPRTPLCGQHFEEAFEKAGAPKGLVSSVFTTHETFAHVLARPEIGFCAFTGSVAGGHNVYREVASSKRFIDCGLELGGKDAAYVAEDADLDKAVENIVDGACYNAGQSCCGIERAFVHRSLYNRFVDAAAPLFNAYVLGDPMDAKTNLGPMALPSAQAHLQSQVNSAVNAGAKIVTGGKATHDAAGKGRFFQPTLLKDCTPDMKVMQVENFGPILAVSPVDNDEQAVKLINDTQYGLTSSLWTRSYDRASKMAKDIQTGTVFMNRCDYLDPHLAWTGVKNTGKGQSLGKGGFLAVTRPKSIHFKF